MDQKLEELLEPAFREVPALEANREIARARREQAGGDPDDDGAPAVRSYELVLTTWESFVREQLPKLVYHLESVGARLPECRGVMLSVFVGERLWFIDAKLAVARISQMLGVTPGQLSERYGLGEKRTAVRDPLLLTGRKGAN
jgi:hypothetical protein